MEDSEANGEATEAYIAALESSICRGRAAGQPKAEIHAFGEELKAAGERCDATPASWQ